MTNTKEELKKQAKEYILKKLSYVYSIDNFYQNYKYNSKDEALGEIYREITIHTPIRMLELFTPEEKRKLVNDACDKLQELNLLPLNDLLK